MIQGFEEVQKTLNWSERSDSLKVTPKVSMTYTQNSGDVPEQRMTAGFFQAKHSSMPNNDQAMSELP